MFNPEITPTPTTQTAFRRLPVSSAASYLSHRDMIVVFLLMILALFMPRGRFGLCPRIEFGAYLSEAKSTGKGVLLTLIARLLLVDVQALA